MPFRSPPASRSPPQNRIKDERTIVNITSPVQKPSMIANKMTGVPMPIMEFVQRFQQLQMQRDTSDELIKDLLIYTEGVEARLRVENQQLRKELDDAHLDLDDARRTRREMQQQLSFALQRMEQSNADREHLKNRNPYIQVLIDGDGMIFNETLVRQGIEGGKAAAAALRNTILRNCSDLTDEIEIMAKVCANTTGLSKAMIRDGSLDTFEQFRDFTLGFTQGKASFDFIDVGHGKERADSKIKECMRWHLRNHNCKQILLGISHDAGYAPFLDEVIKKDDMNRICIIEGPPTVRELRDTGLQVISFDKIFRSEKLTDKLTPHTSPNPGSTWANVTSSNPPLPISASTSPNLGNKPITAAKKPTPVLLPSKPAWSPGPRGLDPAIHPNATILDKIKRRSTSSKLCNNHYLRGPCAKGDECCFEHDYKATEEDLKAIAYLTRLNPCLSGQECELEGCIYGHHCPSVQVVETGGKGGIGGVKLECVAFGCRFGKEDHPPGTVVRHPRKEY